MSPKLTLKATVEYRGLASQYLKQPGDAVLIDREGPRWLIIMCPCGCGEEFPINLDPRTGPAWELYGNQRTGLSLYPSVWRRSGCWSHYIIWRSQILLFDRYESEFSGVSPTEKAKKIVNDVLEQLPKEGFMSFYDIAKILHEIPWEVLSACRELRDLGAAVEAHGKRKGFFRRR